VNVLHVDASILGERSVSRSVSAAVVARLRGGRTGVRVVYRDVAADPLPQFSGRLLAAAASPAEQPDEVRRDAAALAAAVEEVLGADVIVVGAPMYNFGIPSQLKSWIDALAVPGKTFRYADGGVQGLLGDKRVVIVSSQGGFYAAGTPMASFEHQESHLTSFFRFVGVADIRVVRAEGVRVSDGSADRIQSALRQASELAFA
jgi:FMN-dependent NADH-azoreductase